MADARSMLIFSAHAADFVWRAGGAIALYASRGYRVRILCLSFGERGESQGAWKEPGMTVERVKEIRRAESQRAADLLGAELRFFDAGDYPLPRESAAAVADAADQRLAKEQRTRDRLKAGELGLDIYGLRDVLAQRGVVWRD